MRTLGRTKWTSHGSDALPIRDISEAQNGPQIKFALSRGFAVGGMSSAALPGVVANPDGLHRGHQRSTPG